MKSDRAKISRPLLQSYQSRATFCFQPQTNNKGKGIERSIPKSNPQTKCYKCQGYRHIAAKCASSYKIALIDGEGYPESKSDEYIHQVDGDKDDFDENTEETTLNCLQFRESTRYL